MEKGTLLYCWHRHLRQQQHKW